MYPKSLLLLLLLACTSALGGEQQPDKEIIRKHAELGGFPIDRISKVSALIDPSTAQ